MRGTTRAGRATSLRSRWNRRLAGLLATLVLGSVVGWWATRYSLEAFRDTAEQIEAQATGSSELRAEVAEAVNVRHAVIEGNRDLTRKAATLEAGIAAGFERAVQGSDHEGERQLFDRGQARWEQAIAAASRQPLSAAEKLSAHEALAEAGEEVANLVDRAAADGRAGARDVLARAETTERAIFAAMAVLAAVIVALGARLARRLSAEVLVPVARLRDAAERLAGGNLDHRLVVDRADELGQLAASFNTMADVIAGSHHQLTLQASSDPLTGLANRTAFRARLEASMSSPNHRGGSLAVLFVDLDDFKDVNDSLGHAVGDRLLAAVATRMTAAVRPGDLVARLGGDEFAVLLDGVEGPEGATAVAERVLAAVCRPGPSSAAVGVAASIGLAFRDDAGDPEELMRRADVAMYLAKGRGKNRVEHYDPALDAAAADNQRLKTELHGAAERGELVVEYQPIVTLGTGSITGVEALVRWQHPTRGLLPPGVFITAAEETGAIGDIGAWVLEAAACQARAWQRAHDRPDLTVAVNVSARQLDVRGFADRVVSILQHAGLDASTLILELTESAFTDPTGPAIPTLRALRGLGVRIAIDDFGTGYSSLGSLRQLPIDIVKIDRSFVSGHHDDALLDAVVQLGQRLHLDVIAEGIETTDQRARLEDLGCPRGQGYLFARPAPPAVISAMLAAADRAQPAPSPADLTSVAGTRS